MSFIMTYTSGYEYVARIEPLPNKRSEDHLMRDELVSRG